MACVQGEAEIKGTTERVYVMKERKEKIDLLLEENVAEQLKSVDWERLNTAISSRLDKVNRDKTSAIGFPLVFKIAASIAAAAAVILVVVMVRTDRPGGVQIENGRSAVVKFIEPEGTASVEIRHRPAKSQVLVNVGAGGIKLAKCNVEIIDVSREHQENGSKAAWIIISKPEPMYADNGISRDTMSMICLF